MIFLVAAEDMEKEVPLEKLTVGILNERVWKDSTFSGNVRAIWVLKLEE
jgi:hypothetical protein